MEQFNKSEIYRLKCSESNSVFINQIGRNIKVRYLEHYRLYGLQKADSIVAYYFFRKPPSFSYLNNTNILHNSIKTIKLYILETVAIYKNKKSKFPSGK